MELNINKQNLTAISTEQLQDEAKTIKGATTAFVLLLFVLLCLGIYLSLNNLGLLSLILVPFILSPILFVFSKKILIINEEIKNR